MITISSLEFPSMKGPITPDTVYSDTPAADNCSRFAQIFGGTVRLVRDVYSETNNKQFLNTLQDVIRQSVKKYCIQF